MRAAARRSRLLAGMALLAALGAAAAVKPSRAAGPDPQGTALVQQLVSQANGHHLAATTRLFAPTAVLTVSQQRWQGSRAIAGWWHGQFAQGLHLALASAVHLTGSDAGAVLQLSRRRGSCTRGCWERAAWRFIGTRFIRMTLQPMARPSPPQHGGGVVPPPPLGPPPPGVTPTIPTYSGWQSS